VLQSSAGDDEHHNTARQVSQHGAIKNQTSSHFILGLDELSEGWPVTVAEHGPGRCQFFVAEVFTGSPG